MYLEAKSEVHFIDEKSDFVKFFEKEKIKDIEADPDTLLYLEIVGLTNNNYTEIKAWTLIKLFSLSYENEYDDEEE